MELWPRATRRAALASTIAACFLLAAAACSSGGPGTGQSTPPNSPGPSAKPTYAEEQYGAIITQCAIKRGLISRQQLKMAGFGDSSGWLRGGRVTVNPQFGHWWLTHYGIIWISGQTMEQWASTAAQQQQIPARVCGSTAMPSPSPQL